jgi:hypothetical protein
VTPGPGAQGAAGADDRIIEQILYRNGGYVGVNHLGWFLCSDNGIAWTAVTEAIPGASTNDLAVQGDGSGLATSLFAKAATAPAGLATWTVQNQSGIPQSGDTVSSTDYSAAAGTGGVWFLVTSLVDTGVHNKLWRSTDGAAWTQVPGFDGLTIDSVAAAP